ncbi:uncharacterized protein LOC126619983 [Malus sylvestris]|uniref:uncharacterized protein LOC126619983 n=1 Tax=Malus sylvestris TaxID=3752 RepID=UPI0021AC860A|nr:uncharacterized protein LOC126619983 [Malus sylvestris]
MVERCLIAASLAALVCHPSSTIKCFKPKPKPTSPQQEQPKDNPSPPPQGPKRRDVIAKEVPSKSKVKPCPKGDSSSSPSQSKRSAKKTVTTRINAVSELVVGDPWIGVVEDIFRCSWAGEIDLKIERVLRVNHSLDVLHRFEEYRKVVKSRYEKGRILKRMERLVVDGNELLQFHGGTITCSLGINGFSSICRRKCCQVCRLIAGEFSGEALMSLFDNSWKAHEKMSKECAGKGVCASARKAIVVCRVIAGHVAHYYAHAHGRWSFMDNEEGEFDSVDWTADQFRESKELVVLNSEAVLPCFVIIYNVKNKNLP